MMRSMIRCGALAGAVLLGACDLAVENRTAPDTSKVLATPADVEALLGGQFLRHNSSLYGSTANVWGMMNVMSHENFSSLSNNCQGQRVGIPRASNDNAVGNGCASEQRRVYYIDGEVVRVSSNILAKLNTAGFTLGSTAQDQRARAFANFTRGVALGYLAMVYDSAAIITPESSTEDPGQLSGYQDVMTAALASLDDAIAAAQAPGTGTGGFPIPNEWFANTNGATTAAEFIKIVRSYKARFRAGVARTPAERAAVNWAAVIADAQNGITQDMNLRTATTAGTLSNSWVSQWYEYTTWHQMVPFIIGMGDVSGNYEAYIAAPLNDKGANGAFFMVTPDQRFPQGATRAAQQADFSVTSCTAAGSICARDFRNRPTANDQASGPTWGYSNYDHTRYYAWDKSGSEPGATNNTGPFPFMKKAEIDMLQAEGLIRTGSFAAAAALINNTRVGRGGLPAITAFDNTSPVPGGANCVPRVPNSSGTAVACGNMMEAMKWEKRIETAYTHFGGWFFDHRGWGDLPEGTPTHWAPPYEDLLARGYAKEAVYSLGGGLPGSAAKGTYGW